MNLRKSDSSASIVATAMDSLQDEILKIRQETRSRY